MNISVLYVIDTLEIGGTERSLLEIVTRLTAFDVTVCHIYPGDALRSEYERRGVNVISLNIRGKYAPVRTVVALRRLIEDLDPDIVHSMLFRASLFSRLASVRKGVALVDSLVGDSYGSRRFQGLRRLALWKAKAVLRADRSTSPLVDVFIANSEWLAKSNCTALGIPGTRIEVIHRGRSCTDYVVGGERTAALRDELQAKDAPIVVNVARLRPMKGQAELVRAAAHVVREVPGARLVIAGEGPFRSALEALIGRLGMQSNVSLLGYREDVPALLSAADVFVFPSHYEGHPGALVEAMCAGRPIVASDTPEHRETVDHGRTALLVPVGDVERLGRAIVWMLKNSDEAARMGERARRVAIERFSIDEAVRRHAKIYRELVASHQETG